jgi:hypothetical protein
MQSPAEEVLDRITNNPLNYLANRQEDHYERLLALYCEVGYGSEADNAGWRDKSVSTWSKIDSLMPGATTCGIVDGRVVSSWGSISIAPQLLYTHSLCMQKTLEGAVSLFAQAVHHFRMFSCMSRGSFLGAGFANKSGFTPAVFIPKTFDITTQIHIDSLLCHRSDALAYTHASSLDLSCTTSSDDQYLTYQQRAIFNALSQVDPRLMGCRLVTPAAVRRSDGGEPVALLIFQSALPFITAVDIHAEILVFPAHETIELEGLCHSLRRISAIGSADLYLFLPARPRTLISIQGETVYPSFWVATPQEQCQALQRACREAFVYILRKYSDQELGAYLE